MRARGIITIVIVGLVAVGALVFAVATLGLTAIDFVSRSGPAPTEEDSDFGTVEVFQVRPDASLDPLPSGLTATVWATFVRVVGPEFAGATMSEYRAGNSVDSDTFAYVIRDDRDPERWMLAANLAYSDVQSELIATLVHEYAHIVSLSTAEVAPFAKTCDTLELDEGCADDDSYIFAFEQEFWAGYGDAAPDVSSTDVDLGFYDDHEEDFVSSYASTNAVEDFAESFMTFVIEPEPDRDAASPTAAKLLFFYEYADLVDIRDRIRAEFSGEL